jgi:hypothetical protein
MLSSPFVPKQGGQKTVAANTKFAGDDNTVPITVNTPTNIPIPRTKSFLKIFVAILVNHLDKRHGKIDCQIIQNFDFN